MARSRRRKRRSKSGTVAPHSGRRDHSSSDAAGVASSIQSGAPEMTAEHCDASEKDGGTVTARDEEEELSQLAAKPWCCLCLKWEPLKSLVPFVAVVGTACVLFVLPIFALLTLVLFALLSFWPFILIMMPVFVAGAAVGLVCIAAVMTIVWWFGRKQTIQFITARVFFLMPFHALFISVLVSIVSFWWSLAIGAALFVQGEVSWSCQHHKIQRWEACINFFDSWSAPIFNYFPLTIHVDGDVGDRQEKVDGHDDVEETRYIFCYHPHGIFALGLFSLVFSKTSGFARQFWRSKPLVVGVASALLHVPILGRLCSWFGFIPASRHNLHEACKSGYDLAIVPGGIAEMTQPPVEGKETLFLRRRRGFVRLALLHGRALVPVFCFGESKTFVQYGCFRKLREHLSRTLRVSIVFFRGRGCTLTPRQVPLRVVVGKPMKLPKISSPSDDTISRFHAQYMQLVENLFHSHKNLHPDSKRSDLVFI